MRIFIIFILLNLCLFSQKLGYQFHQDIQDPTSDIYFHRVSYSKVLPLGKAVRIHVVLKNSKAYYKGEIKVRLFVAGKGEQFRLEKSVYNLKGNNQERKIVNFIIHPNQKAQYKAQVKIITSGYEKKNNNKKSFAFNIVRKSDLIVCIKAPIKVKLGEKKGIYFKVKNISDFPSPPTKLRVYIKSHGVKYLNVPKLAHNQEKIFKQNARFKTTGKKRVKAIIDPQNIVNEENENNNEKEVKIKVISPISFDSSGLSTFECSN